MLFSRRKRATAVEPETPAASVHSNGADPDLTLDEVPTLEEFLSSRIRSTIPDGRDFGHRGTHGAGRGAERHIACGRSAGGSDRDAAGAW